MGSTLLFGLLVKNKNIFLSQIVGGVVGSAYLGLTKVYTNEFLFGSVTTFPTFVGDHASNFINSMIGLIISLVVSTVITFIVARRDKN